MTSVEVHLLGRFELRRDGVAVELGSRKNAALLAWLALHPQGVKRTRLVSMLWPDSEASKARANLRQALTALRRLGGVALIATQGDEVALDAGTLVDLHRFERLANSAEPADWQRAVALHEGTPLDGLELGEGDFDESLRAQRQRIAAVFSRLLEQSAAAAAGQPALLREVAERWLQYDPASEQAWRAQIDACRRLGDKAAGIRAYQRCRTALLDAYGVAPSGETERVYRELLRDQEPALAQSGGGTLLVLPVQVEGEGSDLQWLARSLTEDVSTELTRFRTLSVVAPAEGQAGLPPRQAARELGARYVLTAAVRAHPPEGSRLRLSVQLVEGSSGVIIWSERFDVEREAVVDATDRVVRELVAALAREIEAHTLSNSRQRGRELSAYEHWVQGMTLLRQGSLEADEQARACFQRALAREPDYARAYSGLSLSHFNEWSCQYWGLWDESQRQAERYAVRAAELDPADHLALCILAKVELYRREFDLADTHFARALRLNPNDADNLAMVGLGYAYLGKHELGLELGEAALRLNPRHPPWYLASVFGPLFLMRRYDEGIAQARGAVGAFVDVQAFLAMAHALAGRPSEASRHARAYLADFERMITHGQPAGPGEGGKWLLDVNPLRLSKRRGTCTQRIGGSRAAAVKPCWQ